MFKIALYLNAKAQPNGCAFALLGCAVIALLAYRLSHLQFH